MNVQLIRMTQEQRTNIKFLTKLGKSATETLSLLQQAYGEECMSRARVFEWHKRFREGREEVEDDPKSGRPLSAKTDRNIELVNQLVRQDRRLTIRMMAEELEMSKESVRTILVENLGMKKICARMVPKLLSEEQKSRRIQVCEEILQQLEVNPDFLSHVITGDESWIFQYDPETKRQSRQWKSPSSPRPRKARMSKSKVKVMLIVFFDCKGLVHYEFVPEGQTVNQEFYKAVLVRLMEKVRRKRRNLWENKQWLLHHDNAPAHSALSIRQFLTSRHVTTLDHPPYSPDLAPCDFFLFPKLKSVLKGNRFEDIDDIKDETTSLLKNIKEEDFSTCFSAWKTRMQKCIDQQGDYFEGIHR